MTACLDLFRTLDLAGSLLWALTYALIVRRASLDRSSGVPPAALASAIAWETFYALHPTPGLPRFVVPLWLAIDAAVLVQFLRYAGPGRRARFAAALAIAAVIEGSLLHDLGDRDGVWSGFAVNVVVSLAFVSMALRRRDVRGQSMYVALCKLLGTAVMVPHAYALHGPLWSLRAFMGVTLFGDVTYAALLHRRCRALGIRPWARL